MSVEDLIHRMKRHAMSDTEAHNLACLVQALMAEREAWHEAHKETRAGGHPCPDPTMRMFWIEKAACARARVDEIIGRIGK